MSHVDTDRGSIHTERDNLGFEPDSTSKHSSNLSHHGFARGGSPDSRAYGDDYRESHARRDSAEDIEMNRVSVAEVHNVYNADDRASKVEFHKVDEEESGEHRSTLRRWPSQESLERASSTKGSIYKQSDRRTSDVGSINPTWRDKDDVEGVGMAAVHGYRQGDTRDSDSEHDITRDEDDDDHSAYRGGGDDGDYRDSLADYERPEGVVAVMVASVEDDDVPSQRSSVAASSQMYHSQGRGSSMHDRPSSIQDRTPSPEARASSYRARTPSPDVRDSSDRERTPSPGARVSSYRARTHSPDVRDSSVRERTPSPGARVSSYRARTPSPDVRDSSVRERTPSPDARASSIRARTPSPTFESQPRTPSPQARAPTPPSTPPLGYQAQQRTPSPMQRQQSPLGGPAPAGVSSGLAGLGK